MDDHIITIERLISRIETNLYVAAEWCIDARLRLRTSDISDAPGYIAKADAAVDTSVRNLRRAQLMVSDAIAARKMREEDAL
jgi:hypothetical protein